jgi:hypothetical protein
VDVGHIGAKSIAGRATVSEMRRAHDRCDLRTAKSCGPGARRLASSVAVMRSVQPGARILSRKATGATVQRSPGRARHKPSNHCAGKAGRYGFTCMPLCRFFTATSHSGPRVPAGARSSLRPLSIEGDARCKARAKCAARMSSHVNQPTTLSCPGRSAASLRRCAAEPGPMLQPSALCLLGSRLCAAALSAESRPGHRPRRQFTLRTCARSIQSCPTGLCRTVTVSNAH